MYESPRTLPPALNFFYTTRHQSSTDSILFLPRLAAIFESEASPTRRCDVFLTQCPAGSDSPAIPRAPARIGFHSAKLTVQDIVSTLGPLADRKHVVVYICGPPGMTDDFVDILGKEEGMDKSQILCEKWW